MDRKHRIGLVLLALGVCAGGVAGQSGRTPEDAYFRAVAEFFGVPGTEIDILRDSRLRPDELPVALFIAERAGVSPEALVALRRSGSGWHELSARYGVGAESFHVPLPVSASAGPVQRLYDQFRATPTAEWSTIRLRSEDVVVLVNVRLIAQSLQIAPLDILARAEDSASFVELYGRLIR